MHVRWLQRTVLRDCNLASFLFFEMSEFFLTNLSPVPLCLFYLRWLLCLWLHVLGLVAFLGSLCSIQFSMTSGSSLPGMAFGLCFHYTSKQGVKPLCSLTITQFVNDLLSFNFSGVLCGSQMLSLLFYCRFLCFQEELKDW